MPSVRDVVKASFSLAMLSSSTPESVTITSPSTGGELLGYFSGWTAGFKFPQQGCKPRSGGTKLVPLTVLSANETVTCDWVRGQVREYSEKDDVFEELFLQTLLIQGASGFEAGLASCLDDAFGTEIVFSDGLSAEAQQVEIGDAVPNGPYLAHITPSEATLGPVYRIFYDELMAFMSPVLPNGTEGLFRYAPVNTISDSTVGVPVPSKLYSSKSESKPLDGVRIAIKDIIDLGGVKTSNGNRAWFKLYDAPGASAPSIQKLVDQGAVVVGKLKTAQFANSDRPTADWVDYHDAFNPRGDGYQDPGVSSAGSGAATAGYDWVDVSIATDTGGSIRIPAGKNGVFAIRPSFGVVSNDGVMEEGQFFDSVGLHTRSPQMLREFGRAWFGDSEQLETAFTAFPKKIIIPAHLWPVANNASQALFSAWTAELASFLGAEVETVDIGAAWNATAHVDYPGTDFWSHMQMVGFHIIWRNQLRKVIEPFRAAYAKAFGGRTPFINPFPAARYETALNTTQEDYDVSYERFTYFRDWFGKNIVKADAESCSDSVFLVPAWSGDTVYRHNVYTPPNVSSWASFTPWYFSVQSQGPEVTFPIGEVSYDSVISNVEEKLPVAIDLLAHRNCDLMLLDLAKALADKGILKEVKTGRTLW